MRKSLYLIAMLVVAFVSNSAYAQLPSNVKVSTASEENWYYIQNGADPTVDVSSTAKINAPETAVDSDKAGLFITSKDETGKAYGYVRNIIANGDAQLWKIVSAGNDTYNLINKQTGKKLTFAENAFYSKAEGTEFTFIRPTKGTNTREVEVTDVDLAAVISYKTGEKQFALTLDEYKNDWALLGTEMEDEYDIPTDTSMVKDKKAWFFVSEKEMADRVYPTLSVGNGNKWNRIEFISSQTYLKNRLIYATYETTQDRVSVKNNSKVVNTIPEETDSVLWKFVPVAGSDAKVTIENMKYAGYYLPLATPYVGSTTGNSFMAKTPVEYIIKDIRNGEFALIVANGNDSTGSNGGKRGLAFANTLAYPCQAPVGIATPNNDDKTARRYGCTFKFSYIDAVSAVKKVVAADDFVAYAENGYIKVEGTDAPVRVYNINGTQVDANRQLNKGVYIVRAGEKSKKIIVH